MDRIRTFQKLLSEHRKNRGNSIALLQGIQDIFGFVPEDAVDWFSAQLDVPASTFFGILTFYPKFRLRPTGRNKITVCCGAACHIKGSDRILGRVRKTLNLSEGEDTTENLHFTVEEATCIGACSIAPVVIVNSEVYKEMDPEKVDKLLKGYVTEDEFIGF